MDAWDEMDAWCTSAAKSLTDATSKMLLDGCGLDDAEYRRLFGQHQAFMQMRSYIHGAKKTRPCQEAADRIELLEAQMAVSASLTKELMGEVGERMILTTVPAEPSKSDRQRYQALCDELDRMGYRPTGWVDPPVLR